MLGSLRVWREPNEVISPKSFEFKFLARPKPHKLFVCKFPTMTDKSADPRGALEEVESRVEDIARKLENLKLQSNQLSAKINSIKGSEEEARYALLDHFSSKSTNQATILFGLAVTFFTIVELYNALKLPFNWQGSAFLAIFLGLFAIVTGPQIGRLLYWGELATATLCDSSK